jgi:hypothetical protein
LKNSTLGDVEKLLVWLGAGIERTKKDTMCRFLLLERVLDGAVPNVAFPLRKMTVRPFLSGALPADVAASFLAFDPLVRVNLLFLGLDDLS